MLCSLTVRGGPRGLDPITKSRRLRSSRDFPGRGELGTKQGQELEACEGGSPKHRQHKCQQGSGSCSPPLPCPTAHPTNPLPLQALSRGQSGISPGTANPLTDCSESSTASAGVHCPELHTSRFRMRGSGLRVRAHQPCAHIAQVLEQSAPCTARPPVLAASDPPRPRGASPELPARFLHWAVSTHRTGLGAGQQGLGLQGEIPQHQIPGTVKTGQKI